MSSANMIMQDNSTIMIMTTVPSGRVTDSTDDKEEWA